MSSSSHKAGLIWDASPSVCDSLQSASAFLSGDGMTPDSSGKTKNAYWFISSLETRAAQLPSENPPRLTQTSLSGSKPRSLQGQLPWPGPGLAEPTSKGDKAFLCWVTPASESKSHFRCAFPSFPSLSRAPPAGRKYLTNNFSHSLC